MRSPSTRVTKRATAMLPALFGSGSQAVMRVSPPRLVSIWTATERPSSASHSAGMAAVIGPAASGMPQI